VLAGSAFKAVEIEQVIRFGREDRVTVVPTLDDVKRLAFGKETGQSGHGRG
jgi:hypothetical protein